MITVTVGGAQGQEKEAVLKKFESALVGDPESKYVFVFRQGAYSQEALDMIPKIIKVFVLE